MTLLDLNEKVEKGELVKLHTSYIREYVSRKTVGYVRPYSGKFGRGYMLLEPNWDSTTYSFVTYFVEG